MQPKETKSERAKRFAKIWKDSRTDANKSQDYMANGLGISKKTVQNWEKGISSPDLFMGSEWFQVLGLNPIPYYLAFLFPDMFENIKPEDHDETIEQALMFLIKNSTSMEKRQLLFLMAGRHGSSWYSLLQLFTAHCHTGMRSRVNVANLVLNNYEMDEHFGELICPENIRPDLTILCRSAEEGKQAVLNRENGYTTATADK